MLLASSGVEDVSSYWFIGFSCGERCRSRRLQPLKLRKSAERMQQMVIIGGPWLESTTLTLNVTLLSPQKSWKTKKLFLFFLCVCVWHDRINNNLNTSHCHIVSYVVTYFHIYIYIDILSHIYTYIYTYISSYMYILIIYCHICCHVLSPPPSFQVFDLLFGVPWHGQGQHRVSL